MVYNEIKDVEVSCGQRMKYHFIRDIKYSNKREVNSIMGNLSIFILRFYKFLWKINIKVKKIVILNVKCYNFPQKVKSICKFYI